MREKLRILLVGAHPADAFDNAGGTLCHHSRQGDQITSLVLTQGTRVHDKEISVGMSRAGQIPAAVELQQRIQERSQVKQQEVKDACALLGIQDVRFLEYDDAVMTVSENLILAVARVMREVRPHVLITHWPGEWGGYADQHAVTSQIALHALQAAGGVYPGDPNPPIRITQVFFMATPSCLARTHVFSNQAGYYADVIVDITDVIDLKVRALDCLRSQSYNGGYARKRVESVDGSLGLFATGARAAYAEGFIRQYSETHDLLPITEKALAWAKMTEIEQMEQYCKLVAHTIPE
ncbi:MAG: PIG-L family deacetylase [Chloroflexi bacterium]|nr:PIG-L family deacetylase [Chloroflexota bacterium]